MLDQQKQCDEKSKVANAIYNERLFTRRRRRILREPEPDQQIRRQTHAFPANEHHQVIVSQHQGQHEKHEQIEIAEKPVVAGIVPHVADGVNVNQKSNSTHYQQHYERELIKIEGKVNGETSSANPVRQILVVGK